MSVRHHFRPLSGSVVGVGDMLVHTEQLALLVAFAALNLCITAPPPGRTIVLAPLVKVELKTHLNGADRK